MNTSLSGIGSAFAAMFGGGTSFAGSGVSLQLKNSLPLLLTCLIGSSVLPRWFGFIWSGLFGMGRSDRIALAALVLLCLVGPIVVGILSALVAVAPYLLAVLLILGVIAFFCK